MKLDITAKQGPADADPGVTEIGTPVVVGAARIQNNDGPSIGCCEGDLPRPTVEPDGPESLFGDWCSLHVPVRF